MKAYSRNLLVSTAMATGEMRYRMTSLGKRSMEMQMQGE